MLQTINEIAETTLKIMESVFELQVSSFHILENENLRTIGVRGGPSVKITLPLKGKGIIEKAAREKHSLLIKDMRKSSDYKKGTTKSMSQLAVPAVIDGETIAVINVESRQINEFTEEDRKLLETLAFHVSFAIDRLKKKGIEIDPKIEESFRLEYALGRLEDAESITHLVKNELQWSLQSIKNASQILKDQPERLIDFTAAIDRKAEQAVNISEEIRETVLKGSIDWDLIEINQVINQTISSFHFPANIEVHTRYLDVLIIVNIHHKKFARVLTNIMRNSVEAMPNGGKLTIHVRHHASNVIIDIKDTGMGIPEEVQDRLFEPFNSTKPNHEGLGLAYSYNEIISAGGNLSIESERSKGTTVTISLPVKRKLDIKK
jgi:signal transduction histidine kinase